MAQDSDSALFGGMIDLGPVSPTFASILAEPQTYQAEPITGSSVHAENTVVSSAQGSDASSSSAPPSPAAAQGMGLLAPRSTAYSQPDTSPIEELLTLIDWQSDNHHAPKRVRGAPEKSHEKHVEHEKRRRNELASAIEEIDNLIPNTALGSASAKRTKLATLQEAAEYFKRVQDMACVLIRENRRLAASLREQPAAPSPAALQSGPGIQRQDIARLFVTTAFLVWIFVGVPTPWLSSSFGSVAFSSRTVLSLDGEGGSSVIMAGLHVLAKVAAKIAVFLTAFFVVWICTLVQELPRIPSDDLRAAEALLVDAAQSVERNSNWVVAQVKHTQAMALLRKPLPSSLLGELMFFVVQFLRASLNLLVVGLWIERALVYILGRQEASALDSKGYMLGARLGPGGPLKSRPLRYFSCVLGAASGLNVINAPLRDKDELGHRIGLFLADMPARRAHFLVSSLLLSLAEAQLNPIRLNMPPEDVSDWTLLRMLESHVHQGKLEEALSYIMSLLPALPDGPAKVKAICSAGTVNFCLRRYREAFLMIQTAVSLGSACNLMPVIAVRFLTGTILVALYQLGQKEEARSLLSHYESMYTCMPDVRSNIMPNERHVLDVTKIILTDDDYPAVMLHTREMLSIVARHGLQRCFNLPYTLEIVLERLFGAIQLSNDAAEKTSRTPSEVFVLHQREEICEMCESVIDMLVRAAFWAPYTQPIVERAKGWLALLNRDRATASYHLNRALLEARRMDVPHQETYTIELMQKLGVPLLGDEAKEVRASDCPSVAIKACVTAIFGGTTAATASGAV